MSVKVIRIYQLDGIVNAGLELKGGFFEVEVPAGPVAGGYINKRLGVEQLAELLGASPSTDGLSAEQVVEVVADLLQAGTGITITRTTDGKLEIASSVSVGAVGAPPQSAPTAGVVDDIGDTFSFLPNPAYPSFAQYKANGLPGVTGAVVLDGTNSYVQGARIYVKVVGAVAKGGLAVYVAGSGNMPDGQVLTNAEPFTGVAPTPTPPTAITPDAPFPTYDPVTRVLTFQHALGTSELEYNRFGGSFTSYAPIQIDDAAHNAGEWKARVRAYAAGNRNASGTADSPAITAKATVNRIPVADAGDDLTIQLPTSSVALMGTATDPDAGDTLTYAWRYITGPNVPTGLPATTLNVVVSGLIAGTYQLGFRTTDNHGAQSPESYVLLTVKPVASGGKWANAKIITTVINQSNGQTFSPVEDLTPEQVASAQHPLNGIWNPDNQQVEEYKVGVNDDTIPAGVVAGYRRGMGLEAPYFAAARLDPAMAGIPIIAFKAHQLQPPNTDTNGIDLAYFRTVTKARILENFNNFSAWMVAQGYPAPLVTSVAPDIGENDSFINNTNYAADFTTEINYLRAAKFYAPNAKFGLPLLQRAAGTQNDSMINAQKLKYVLENSSAYLWSIPNPEYFDNTHFTGQAMWRRGLEWRRKDKLSLTPTITEFSPTSQSVGGQVTLTGTNFKYLMSAQLNGVAITQVDVRSDTKAIITIPEGAANGTFTITTANGSGSIAGFNVSAAPVGPTPIPGTFVASGKQFFDNKQMPNPSDGTAVLDTNPELDYLSGYGCVSYSDANVFVSAVFEMSGLWYAEWAAPTNTGLAPLDIAIIEAATGTVVQQTRINPVGTFKKSETLFTMFNIVKGRYYARWNKAGGGVGIMDQMKASLV
jgi:hypothetical protein